MIASRTDHYNSFGQACQDQQRGADLITKYTFASTTWTAKPDQLNCLVFDPSTESQLFEMLATTIHVEHADTSAHFVVGSASVNRWFDQPGVYVLSCLPRRLHRRMTLYAETSKPCKIVSHHIDYMRQVTMPVKIPDLYKMYTTQRRYEYSKTNQTLRLSCYTSHLVTLEVQCATMLSCKLLVTPGLPMGMFGATIHQRLLVGEQTSQTNQTNQTSQTSQTSVVDGNVGTTTVRFDIGCAFCNVDDLSIDIVHQPGCQPASALVVATNLNFLHGPIEHADMVSQKFCF